MKQLNSVKATIQEVAITDLIPHPDNPRADFEEGDGFAELMRSIEKHGVTNTPIVRPSKRKKGYYQIISGHRRIKACQELGHMSVKVDVRELTDEEALFTLMVENMNRADLNHMEEAKAWTMMCERLKMDPAELAQSMNVKEKVIRARQALLNLPEDAQNYVAKGSLSISVAQLLLALPIQLKENGCNLILDQIELDLAPTYDQAKDLLRYEIIEPYNKRVAWEDSEKEYMDLAYKMANSAARIGEKYEDPLIQYGKYTDTLKPYHREALSPVSIHERAGEGASLLWLHVAQRHNVPVILIPRGETYVSLVDVNILLQAETAIAEGIKRGEEMLRREELSDSMRREAQALIAETCFLKTGVVAKVEDQDDPDEDVKEDFHPSHNKTPAWWDGYNSQKVGIPNENPKKDPAEYTQWEIGWLAAKNEKKAVSPSHPTEISQIINEVGMDESEQYLEGYLAAHDGIPQTSSPYEDDTEEALEDWKRGWVAYHNKYGMEDQVDFEKIHFQNGYDCAKAGGLLSDNPFSRGKDCESWEKGFKSAGLVTLEDFMRSELARWEMLEETTDRDKQVLSSDIKCVKYFLDKKGGEWA